MDAEGPRPLEVPPVAAAIAQDGHARSTSATCASPSAPCSGDAWGSPATSRAWARPTDRVDQWSRYILPIEFDDVTGWTLQNMLIVARLMIAAAIARRESRGVHYRRDFPQPDPASNRHISHAPSPRLRSGPRSPAARSGWCLNRS